MTSFGFTVCVALLLTCLAPRTVAAPCKHFLPAADATNCTLSPSNPITTLSVTGHVTSPTVSPFRMSFDVSSQGFVSLPKVFAQGLPSLLSPLVLSRRTVAIELSKPGSHSVKYLPSVNIFTWAPTCTGTSCTCQAEGAQVTRRCQGNSWGSLWDWLLSLIRVDDVFATQEDSRTYTAFGADANTATRTCTIESPAVVPLCVRLQHSMDTVGESISVQVIEKVERDDALLKGFLAFLGLGALKPILVQNPFMQMLIAASMGVAFLGGIALWALFRDLKDTRIGKVGLAGVFAVGGATAMTEGAMSAFFLWMNQLLGHNYARAAIAVAGVGSAVISKCFFAEKMQAATLVGTTLLQIGYGLWLLLRNREAFAALSVFWLMAKVFGSAYFAKLNRDPSEPAGDAIDALPAAAFETSRDGRPTCASGLTGTRSERMRKYDAEGAMHTKRALEELAAYVRGKGAASFAGRVHNVNALSRFAGDSDSD